MCECERVSESVGSVECGDRIELSVRLLASRVRKGSLWGDGELSSGEDELRC